MRVAFASRSPRELGEIPAPPGVHPGDYDPEKISYAVTETGETSEV
jgi:hypothetical protein